MSWLPQVFSYLMHIDTQLEGLLVQYSLLFWGIVFIVLFAETGFVMTSFLPGETLLFAVGALVARQTGMSIWPVFAVMFAAAVLGDSANYWIGRTIGLKAHGGLLGRVLKAEKLEQVQAFYSRHGSKSVIMAMGWPPSQYRSAS